MNFDQNIGDYNDSIANIPGTSIHIYSVLMAVAILTSIILSWFKMNKLNIPTITLESSILIIVPVGLLGARLWFILNHLDHVSNWIDIFAVWEGGLAIQGGVFAGFLVGFFLFRRASKKYNISMWVYMDCILPNILLGQAIGRWGNFFNQELLGMNTGSPFSWLPAFINDHLHYGNDPVEVYRQPLFLYESLCSVSGFLILTFVVPKMGGWFSKKPWVLEPKKYEMSWKKRPIEPFDYLMFWVLFKKLRSNSKCKKAIWIEAYYDFEPKTKIKEPIMKQYKVLRIDPTLGFWHNFTISFRNKIRQLKAFLAKDAKPLNDSYNPNHYRITSAGVAGSCYFLFYGIARSILEPFRDARDIMMIGGVSTTLIISVLWIISGILLIVVAQTWARQKFRNKGWFYERQY